MGDAYYNDNDPKVCAWLRELIKEGLIADGEVDERSILDVRPGDLAGFTQCHFFAGIGGWSYALRLAGWLDDRPVWTGSCPCQPFSVAGKGLGEKDERHLWPEFRRLIAECRPPVVFGEQVASKAAERWIDRVQDDLENIAYAFGKAVLPACSVGSPTVGPRFFWVAEAEGARRRWRTEVETRRGEEPRRSGATLLPHAWPGGNGCSSSLVVSDVCSPSYGLPGRVGLLRGAGNAIVPQCAQTFIEAFMSTTMVHAR